MSIKLGSARVGHRVGGFYVSTPVTGRNAGRSARIGHRLPGGFYASAPITGTGSRRPKRPVSANPLIAMIATTVLFGVPAVLLLVTPAFLLGLILLAATVINWLRWAANPQDR